MVNFINFALATLVPVRVEGLPETRSENDRTTLRLQPSDMSKDITAKLKFSSLFTKDATSVPMKIQVFNMSIELVDVAGDLWKSIPAFPELFGSTKEILTSISKSSPLPSSTMVLIRHLIKLSAGTATNNPRDLIPKNKTLLGLKNSPNSPIPPTNSHSLISSPIHDVIFLRFQE